MTITTIAASSPPPSVPSNAPRATKTDQQFDALMKAFLRERWILIDKTRHLMSGKVSTDLVQVAFDQMRNPRHMYYYSYDRMHPALRSEFMDTVKEARRNESTYVIMVRGTNFGFMPQYTIEMVIDAIKQSGLDLHTVATDLHSMQACLEHSKKVHQCGGCKSNTILGARCCPNCKQALCNPCASLIQCPSCNAIPEIAKTPTKHCSGLPICTRISIKKRCGWCKVVFYCSETCMATHWAIHRRECKGSKPQ